MIKIVHLAAVLEVATGSTALAGSQSEYQGTLAQRASCRPDVYRLCAAEIPNVARHHRLPAQEPVPPQRRLRRGVLGKSAVEVRRAGSEAVPERLTDGSAGQFGMPAGFVVFAAPFWMPRTRSKAADSCLSFAGSVGT